MVDQMRHKACNPCRERKIKCDGVQPTCHRCARYGVQCSYAAPVTRQSKADVTAVLDMFNNRLLQAEAALAAQWQMEAVSSQQPPSIVWPQFPVTSSGISDSEMASASVLPSPADLAQLPPTSLTNAPCFHQASLQNTTPFTFSPLPAAPMGLSLNAHIDQQNDGEERRAAVGPAIMGLSGTGWLPSTSAGLALPFHPISADAGEPSQEYESNPSVYGASSASAGTRESPWPQHESGTHSRSGSLPEDSSRSRYPSSPPPPPPAQSRIEGGRHPAEQSYASASSSQVSGKRRRRDNTETEADPHGDWTQTHDAQSGQNSQPGSASSKSSRLLSRARSQQQPGHIEPPPVSMPEVTSLPPEIVCRNRQERRKIGHGSAFNNLTKLRGTENYLEWTRGIRAAARKEGVWDLIMGQCPPPKDPGPHATVTEQREFQDDMIYWTNKNDLALGGLEGSLETAVQLTVDDFCDARLMWLKLEEEYKPQEQVAVFDLLYRLDTLSLQDYSNVQQYAEQFRQIQARVLSALGTQPLPTWYFTVRFLRGLGPSFDNLAAKIINSEAINQGENNGSLSIPSVEDVLPQVLQEEQALKKTPLT